MVFKAHSNPDQSGIQCNSSAVLNVCLAMWSQVGLAPGLALLSSQRLDTRQRSLLWKYLISPLKNVIYVLGMSMFVFVSVCKTYIYVTYSDSSLSIAMKYFRRIFTLSI